MERQNVSSSNLASVGYDSDNSILEIEFNHGGIYQFYDVPENVFNDLMNASSHGKYFSANIKNIYQFNKM